MKRKKRKIKEPEFKFIVDVPPDEDTIRRSHEVLAKAFVNKYGVENMKRVLEELKKQQ